MQLHDAVGISCKEGSTILNIRAQMSSIRAKGCMLMIVCVCVCVIWLDMTTPPWFREKIMIYYVDCKINKNC